VTRAVFADATPLMAAQYDCAAAAIVPGLVIHHGPAGAEWVARVANAEATLVFQTRVSAAML
jgi:hypothetical protein